MAVKKIRETEVKIERNDAVIVSEAVAKIKVIVSEVKAESFSNFEKVKSEVGLMLMRPEDL